MLAAQIDPQSTFRQPIICLQACYTQLSPGNGVNTTTGAYAAFTRHRGQCLSTPRPRPRRCSRPVCNITNCFNSVTGCVNGITGCVCLGLARRGYPGHVAVTAVTPRARPARSRDPTHGPRSGRTCPRCHDIVRKPRKCVSLPAPRPGQTRLGAADTVGSGEGTVTGAAGPAEGSGTEQHISEFNDIIGKLWKCVF